ncbi:MAG: helix-turn-helix transcriptional regulator [Anaerolineae bacterium]|nr:helix-turn-helix transcriptional regulator [Anaerolineae bacterium]
MTDTLGSFMKQILDERGMSGNMLAQASGVSESTVRSLLKQGEDDSAPGPHPLVLRAVCDVLGLDHVRIFQMAGYIPDDYHPTHLSPDAEYVGLCYDALEPAQQVMIKGMLTSLDKTNAFPFNGDQMGDVIKRVGELRQIHPMFRARKFTAADEVGRVTGKALRPDPSEWFLNSSHRRLVQLFEDDPAVEVTRKRVFEVSEHPSARAILNMLLPRKEIPSALEKLYWLLRPMPFYHRDVEAMTEDERAGCRALWRLLDEVAQA